MAMTLSAGPGTPAFSDENGKKILTLRGGDVTFNLKMTSDADVTNIVWKTGDAALATTTNQPETSGKSSTATIEGTAADVAFFVEADDANGGSIKSDIVVIAHKSEDPGEPDNDPGTPKTEVREVEVGQFSWPFALLNFLAIGAFAYFIASSGWQVIASVGLPGVASVEKDAVAYGTWSERSAAVVVIGALVVGSVVLLLGLWLAALETRGRLRKPVNGRATVQVTVPAGAVGKGVTAEVLKEFAVVLDAASKMRGAIAVIVAGTLIVLASVWAASGIDSADPDPGQTQAPSGEPSDGATDEPSDDPTDEPSDEATDEPADDTTN